jgi:hypothetical protein
MNPFYDEDEDEGELASIGAGLGVTSPDANFGYTYSDDPDLQADKAVAKSAISSYIPQAGEPIPGELDSEKSIHFALDRNKQMLDANETKFANLSLQGGKDEEDEVGQMVAQALLALVPVAGGYLLGGNRGGVAGARAGLGAQKTFQDTLLKDEKKKELKAAAEAKGVLAERQALLKQREGLEKEERAGDRVKEAEVRKYGPDGLLINYQEGKARRGLGEKGTSITVSLEKQGFKESLDAVQKSFEDESLAAESSKNVLLAVDNYLAKNPEAANETLFSLTQRKASEFISPTPEGALFNAAQAINRLKTGKSQVAGVLSAQDQQIVDDAVIQGMFVTLPVYQQAMEAIYRGQVEKKRRLAQRGRALMSGDVEQIFPLDEAPPSTGGGPSGIPRGQYDQMSAEQKKAFLKSGGKVF